MGQTLVRGQTIRLRPGMASAAWGRSSRSGFRQKPLSKPAHYGLASLSLTSALLTSAAPHCMAGNQPRVEARRFSPETGELRFEFFEATNLATPADGHMHNATLKLVDQNHIVSEWEFYENGKKKATESFNYVRIR